MKEKKAEILSRIGDINPEDETWISSHLQPIRISLPERLISIFEEYKPIVKLVLKTEKDKNDFVNWLMEIRNHLSHGITVEENARKNLPIIYQNLTVISIICILRKLGIEKNEIGKILSYNITSVALLLI